MSRDKKQQVETEHENQDSASFYGQPHENDVGRLARTAARWSIASLIVKQLLGIGTTMVVSRLVTPADFGIAGMALSFVAFLVLFDTGLTWATVQSQELSKDKIDSLFGFGVFLGTVLWAISILAGPILAKFYNTPELSYICILAGFGVFLNSLSTQPAALLKRQLRQKITNSIDTTALVASSLIAILMAILGYGIWAVVGQAVTLQAVRAPLLLHYSGYRPHWPRVKPWALPELKVGTGFALSNFICYFQLYLGGILVGRYFGSVALGLYQKAYNLKSLPTSYATMVVTDVMVSSLAALRSNPVRMGEAYRKALALTAFIGCPAGALLYPMAPEVIRFFYGTQWGGAVPLLKWFSIAAVALPISTSTIWLFLAAGKVKDQLVMNVLLSLLSLGSLFMAARLSTNTGVLVAVESLAAAIPFLALNIYFSHRVTNIEIRKTVKIIVPILFASLIAALSSLGITSYIGDQPWFLLLVYKGIVGVVVYSAIAFAIVRPLPVPKLEYLRNRSLQFSGASSKV